MEESAASTEVGPGNGDVGAPGMRSSCVGPLIAGSPTKLSLLTGTGPAETGERVS